eukprot:3901646-Amphidinium_carterae.1
MGVGSVGRHLGTREFEVPSWNGYLDCCLLQELAWLSLSRRQAKADTQRTAQDRREPHHISRTTRTRRYMTKLNCLNNKCQDAPPTVGTY